MGAMSLRLTEELEDRLAKEAELEGKPRSELVREALHEFLQRRERDRFMAEMVAEAKEAYSDPGIRREAIEMAEEFLPLDNEALEIAEGLGTGESRSEKSGEKWWK
jgi:predicted DNA-binding protein